MKSLSTIVASLVFASISTGAFAACNPPSEVGPSDTILQFANKSAPASKGAIGTKSKLNATLPGTLFYDHVAGSLKLCSGRDWIAVGGTQESDDANFPIGSIWNWSKSYSAVTTSQQVTSTPPLVEDGNYKMTINMFANSGTCTLSYQSPGGNWKKIAMVENDDGVKGQMVAGVDLYGHGNDIYSYSQAYHYQQESLPSTGPGSLYWGGVGNVNWNGKLKFDVVVNGSSASCSFEMKLLRHG